MIRKIAARLVSRHGLLLLGLMLLISNTAYAQTSLDARENTYRAAGIGQIVCGDLGHRYVSTGSVLGDRLTVLTVAHFNIQRGRSYEVDVGKCEFRLIDKRGYAVFRSKFSILERGGGLNLLNVTRAVDWAVLRLAMPTPRSAIPLELGVKTTHYDPNIKYDLVGFAAEFDNFKSLFVSEHCDPTKERENSLVTLHKCWSGPGASGAPIVTFDGERLTLVAIHAATGDDEKVGVQIAGRLRDVLDKVL